MSEIAKLRQRLSNVSRNVKEYKMTVDEAKSLLAEIDNILTVKVVPTKELTRTVITKIMDGGHF